MTYLIKKKLKRAKKKETIILPFLYDNWVLSFWEGIPNMQNQSNFHHLAPPWILEQYF